MIITNMQDFSISVTGGPSEDELLELRLTALRRQNEERLRVVEAENTRLWDAVILEAKERANAAGEEAR